MDELGEDAYPAIYDEHDREIESKASNASCCAGLSVFIVIGLILVLI